MNIRSVTIVAVLAAFLAGCQTNGYGQKQVGGTLLGAGLGGLLGSQFGSGSGKLVATGLGVFAGGLIGSEIGRSIDRADRAYMNRATERAAVVPVGQTVTWRNPDSGNYGAVTPTREGVHNGTGAYCREYQQEVIVGGQREQSYGQACRQPDGSWKII